MDGTDGQSGRVNGLTVEGFASVLQEEFGPGLQMVAG